MCLRVSASRLGISAKELPEFYQSLGLPIRVVNDDDVVFDRAVDSLSSADSTTSDDADMVYADNAHYVK